MGGGGGSGGGRREHPTQRCSANLLLRDTLVVLALPPRLACRGRRSRGRPDGSVSEFERFFNGPVRGGTHFFLQQ